MKYNRESLFFYDVLHLRIKIGSGFLTTTFHIFISLLLIFYRNEFTVLPLPHTYSIGLRYGNTFTILST